MPAAGARWCSVPPITGTPITAVCGRPGPRPSGQPASRRRAGGLSWRRRAPNTILSDAGQRSGHVDLGAMGTADRWADLAVATWSAGWNYGPGWEGQLLAADG